MGSFRKFVFIAMTAISFNVPFADYAKGDILVNLSVITNQTKYFGTAIGLLASLCASGQPAACVASATSSVLLLDVDLEWVLDKQQLYLAKEDAKAFLVAGEITSILEGAIQSVRDAAQSTGHDELAVASSEEIAAQIYLFQAQ